MLIALDRVDAWIVMLIISREVAVSALRATSKSWDSTLKPSRIGKWKAFFQFAAVIPLMVHYHYHVIVTIDFNQIGTILLYVALALTLWSGVDYFVKFYREYSSKESVSLD
jgi:CDP-diacylglycerol--glycerol-3-phosphate 3-phosphatidyltransferase